MSGRHKWSEILAKKYPEVINARFPEGTKARIQAVADDSMMRYANEHPDLRDDEIPLLSPSVLVRRAVMEYLEREETKGDPTDRSS